MKLRVATWNIRKCIGLDRRRDPHRTARVVAGLEADIVALQEADKRLGRRPAALTHDLVEREIGMVPVDAGGHEPSLGWHGNAVLLSERIEVEDRHAIHLPGVEPRGALIVDLAAGGRALRIVAVHLGFIRWARRAQFATIRARLDAMERRPTILLGDFNEWSREKGLEQLAGFDVCAPGPSFHAARPVAALDRIAYDEGIRIRTSGIAETPDTRVASDHLPVWAEVEIV